MEEDQAKISEKYEMQKKEWDTTKADYERLKRIQTNQSDFSYFAAYAMW